MEIFLGKLLDEIRRNPILSIIISVIITIFLSLTFIIFAFILYLEPKFYVSNVEYSKAKESFYSLEKDYNLTKSENETLKKQLDALNINQQNMSFSVCQRYAIEIDNLTAEQRKTKKDIEEYLSPYGYFSAKGKELTEADQKRAEELSKYSDQLNQRILRLNEKLGECRK